ncbi:8-amino-7-oxononanoate synthase [Breznakibacter xylanolyticus]|uniref:8-amino-7-oxononanoate synthase n=1 Tax=Breznakibacter xylanolyticus TaxID=990 RepID=A0A2W7NIT6_9BACT|nr:8-amino-7-oxononanoate synthase [Breznakibacter xylanolyticus]PZX18037.1 8-amino-7-oxononanoate synthase [Breznakibacter xylanolyticus]
MNHFSDQLSTLQQSGLLRQMRHTDAREGGMALLNGTPVVNLSSNDYLGLAVDAALQREWVQQVLPAMGDALFSASSSRLLTGNHSYYERVEAQLERMYGRSALFFNSGCHANMGILPALTGKDDLILSDKLVHASLIDGIRLSEATHVRYRHLDYERLEALLREHRHRSRRVFIVTESVYSMDGDVADLPRLVALKQQYDALLMVDEAHAVGARGEHGLGVGEETGCLPHIDLLVGTMGKALSSVGAYVICDETVKQLLINRCRTLIFTTALPPVNMAWSLLVLERIRAMNSLREQLRRVTATMVQQLAGHAGVSVDGQSNILPVMIGDNHAATRVTDGLLDAGFMALSVRPPAVPPGTARLRLSLTANLQPDDLSRMAGVLKTLLEVSRNNNAEAQRR